MTSLPRLVAFDLDDTLAESKSALDPRMAELLVALLERTSVCIISGGQIVQFQNQVLDHLGAASADALGRLHLMPTCGTRYDRYDGTGWTTVYKHDLTEDQKSRAMGALETEAKRLGLWAEQTWGPILEDRGSQITFSALGQAAPVAEKTSWDDDGAKKESLRAAVQALLPDLEVRSGGSTSVDITMAGVDKAFGMTRLEEHTGIPLAEMVFVGDRLDEGGNDYPVLALGVPSVAVHGWQDTAAYLESLGL